MISHSAVAKKQSGFEHIYGHVMIYLDIIPDDIVYFSIPVPRVCRYFSLV